MNTWGSSWGTSSAWGISWGAGGGPSRSHKQEKNNKIDWNNPFFAQKEELVQLDQKIIQVKKEIQESKKEVNYSDNLYALTALSNRVDTLVDTLETLLKQRERLKKLLTKSPKAKENDTAFLLWYEQQKKEREEIEQRAYERRIQEETKVLKILEAVDRYEAKKLKEAEEKAELLQEALIAALKKVKKLKRS